MKRLTPATLFMLMLIGVGGLVLAYAGKKLLARQEVVEGPAVDLLPVAVADIPAGTLITQAHIGQARILRSRIAPETARTERVVIGRVVKNALKRAEPINMVDLYPPNEFPPLDVAPGLQAVSIDLGDSLSTVAGLKPGQYVDVHFTPGTAVDPTGGPFTMTLFKGVKVLALGTPGSSVSGGVTLELTASQSNVLILAKDRGGLQLTYTPDGKGSGGVAVKDADRATLSEILGLSEPKVESPFVTEIFSAGDRRVQMFKDGQRVDAAGDVAPSSASPRPAAAPAAGASPAPPAGNVVRPVTTPAPAGPAATAAWPRIPVADYNPLAAQGL